ncbi:hypothetical protein [Elizabethkingia meningoseptica]|uniref:hypothetical protein n=1 Tax=Elizabethkingia meningoseptica TaxID=238 RepID=UPI002011CDB2|nr:hypothetical protein [Elizabethkingia meningoseptica]MCL1677087.1 hypothetical protein [Elizabethkingia meningoseptica]MCL1688012.1 hypothetical protein [Elizabethkingia meningoseptica]MDE5491966.1 hypothetical protein [Elizabethkingia meningoseptica]MEC4710386.1 hypothetical protein [Elizabethkingia meningoseptica]
MSELIIRPKDASELNLLENLLTKMKIPFEINEDTNEDFILTKDMKELLDERLKEDEKTFTDAFKSLKNLSEKHGL